MPTFEEIEEPKKALILNWKYLISKDKFDMGLAKV